MEKTVSVPEKKLEELSDCVDRLCEELRHPHPKASKVAALQKLEESAHKLDLLPLASLTKPLEAIALESAKALEKQIQCEFLGFHSLELRSSLCETLQTALSHAIRNSIAHGIESPTERIAADKNAFGKLKFLAHLRAGHLEVTLRDDGRGVDTSKISRKAIEKGIRTPAQIQKMLPREVLSLLFTPLFSTQNEVSVLSGRGVGLDAVKSAIEQHEGTAELHAIEPTGLELRLNIPLDRVGLEAVPVRIGTETVWFSSNQIEILQEVLSDSGAWIRLPLAETLRWTPPSPNRTSPNKRLLRFCTESSTAEVLEIDEVGKPQFQLFRPLDPIWKTHGPPWWKQWIAACDGHALASRRGEGLGFLADETVILRLVNSETCSPPSPSIFGI